MKNLFILFLLTGLSSCSGTDFKEISSQVYKDSKLSVCESTCRASLKPDDYNGLAACKAMCRRQNQKK